MMNIPISINKIINALVLFSDNITYANNENRKITIPVLFNRLSIEKTPIKTVQDLGMSLLKYKLNG